ncbi:predicted protein, partial [Nematostella vectensis]
ILNYINDLPDCISFMHIAMFADNTKCFRAINSPNYVPKLQRDLHSLSAWALDNKPLFRPTKC